MKERSTAEWLETFESAGVLAGRVNDYGQWLAEPQVAATDAADEVNVTGDARLPVPRTPGRAPETRAAPKTGQDADRLRDEFGLSS